MVRLQRVEMGVVEALVVAVAMVVVAFIAGVVSGLLLVAPAGRAVAGVLRQPGARVVVVVVVAVLVQTRHRASFARRVPPAALHRGVSRAPMACQVP